jgi:hypothetical protein
VSVAPVGPTRRLTLVAIAIAVAVAVAVAVPVPALGAQAHAASATATRATPPPAARFSYQIGGAFPPAAAVRIVDRDWHDQPVRGLYNVCYVNGYQAQSDELGWWRSRHRNLLLYRNGRPVIDTGWNEQLLDTSTPAKRAALSAILGSWMATCARKGFQAVEPDNLDSWQRSQGRLNQADNVAFARALIQRAHHAGLAIAQKNTAEIGPAGRRAGFDFAIAEECQAYSECGAYTRVYGREVIEVEYPDNGGAANFAAACRARGSHISIEYRDRDVLARGQRGYLERWCAAAQ